MIDAATVTFRISGKSFNTIRESDLFINPQAYETTVATTEVVIEASDALRHSTVHRAGVGYTHIVTCRPVAARVILDYCLGLGDAFAAEADQTTRADGKALLATADRIADQLWPGRERK